MALHYRVDHYASDFDLDMSAEENVTIDEYPFWPADSGLSEESIQYMIDLTAESGLLTTPMDAADVVDRATLERAVELANQPVG